MDPAPDRPDGRAPERGYAMAALIVGIAVMGVLASVALPVLSQAAKREKEAELIFRGEQYARAVGLFQRRMGPGTLPPNIDVLVDQRFLRRKFLDPITGKDFRPVSMAEASAAGFSQAAAGGGAQQGQAVPGQVGAFQGGTASSGLGGTPAGQGLPAGSRPAGGQVPAGGAPGGGIGAPTGQGPGGTGQSGVPSNGIIGVVSRSTDASVRLYNGRNKYDEWAFVYNAPSTAAGGGAPGGAPGSVQGGPAGTTGPAGLPPVTPGPGISRPQGGNLPMPTGMPPGGGVPGSGGGRLFPPTTPPRP